jgi:prophage antirepressor-like protein
MTNLMIFKKEDFGEVRVIKKGEESWFIAKDVGTILGYSEAKRMYDRIDDEDRKMLTYSERDEYGAIEIPTRGLVIINESGLYSAILGSELPSAKQFKRWITSEVLPQIRQTGGYIPTKEDDDDESIMAKAFIIATKTIEKKEKVILQQKEKIDELTPKAESFDDFINAENYKDMNNVAKDLGTGRTRLFEFLRNKGVLMANNVPYQRFMEAKYFVVKEKTVNIGQRKENYSQTFVTPKGIEYISKLLKKETIK